MKYDLSIIVPAIGGRINRLKAIISRLTLNKARHPNINFEVIIVDGSLESQYKNICEFTSQYLSIKYISLPIGRPICAAYPRNTGYRIAEGSILTMIDIDYFIGEDFIVGAMEPFKTNKNIINNGYVIDSSFSKLCNGFGDSKAENLNNYLLSSDGLNVQILSAYEEMKIPGPQPATHIWLYAAPRENMLKCNFYDEIFCRQFAYSVEDDSMFHQLESTGLTRYTNEYNKFLAIHLWHNTEQRNYPQNKLNKEYYQRRQPKDFKRNIGWEYGKLLNNSFSIINGETLNPEQHETWIKNNITDIQSYNNTWGNINDFIINLEKYNAQR